MQVLILIISYVLGSIPFGFIIARLIKGIDIRKFGSGNIGATNVARVVGIKWGFIVFVLDFLKGMIPIIVVFNLYPDYSTRLYIGIALAAILGHNWSIFLFFKGGKGVATSIGTVSGLCFKYPDLTISASIAVISWVLIFLICKKVSLASMTAAFSFLVSSLFLLTNEFKIAAFVIFTLIIIRHRSNIKNLLKGDELSV